MIDALRAAIPADAFSKDMAKDGALQELSVRL
jgi:hypothetical protein